MDELIK